MIIVRCCNVLTVWRLVTLAMGIFIAFTVGINYMFSALSGDLAKAIGVNNVDIVGSIGDLGNFFGVFGGLIADKQGPKWALLYCTILSFSGYFLSWLSIKHYITPELWSMCIFYFFVGQGQSSGFITSLSVNLRNWHPRHRGKIAGLLVGIISLTPVITTPLYSGPFGSNISNFFLFLTIFVGSVSTLSIFLLRDVSQIIIPVDDEIPFGGKNEYTREKEEKSLITKKNTEENVTFPKVMLHLEFYLIWLGMFFCLGSSLMWKNILGTVNESFHMNERNIMVITWSLLDGFGRSIIGLLHDIFASRIPRPAWSLLPMLLMVIGNVLFLFIKKEAIWFLHIVFAIGTASVFGLVAGLHPFYWGSKYAGLNLGLLLTAPGLGGTLLTFIATEIYLNVGSSGVCYGAKCFNSTISITSVLVTIAFILFVYLTVWHYVHHIR